METQLTRTDSLALDRAVLGMASPALASAISGRRADLARDVEVLRIASARPPATTLRRLLFVWLRIYVNERKANGSWERVDLRLPLPIPLLGALLRRRMDAGTAIQALARIEQGGDTGAALARQVEAFTGFELIRVEESKPEQGKASLVVIGID